MDRRAFMRGAGALTATALIPPFLGGCAGEEELESRLLTAFAKGSRHNDLTTEQVFPLLYNLGDVAPGEKDVLSDFGPGPRALHIGDGYFLANHHTLADVIQNDVSPSTKRLRWQGFAKDVASHEFEILHHDRNADLALLRSSGFERTGTPLVTLASDLPEEGETVSKFRSDVYTQGVIDADTRRLPPVGLEGVDICDRSKPMKLGSITFHTGGYLPELGWEEKTGQVLRHKTCYFDNLPDGANFPENHFWSSILSYNGDSGSPLFRKSEDGHYSLVGLVVGGLGIKHILEPPDYHAGKASLQQTITEGMNQSPIGDFITGYLQGQKPKS